MFNGLTGRDRRSISGPMQSIAGTGGNHEPALWWIKKIANDGLPATQACNSQQRPG